MSSFWLGCLTATYYFGIIFLMVFIRVVSTPPKTWKGSAKRWAISIGWPVVLPIMIAQLKYEEYHEKK